MQKKNNENNRILSIDVFKAIAIIFVIILHIYVSKEFELRYAYPFTINLCIPIFMICTGFNLSLSDNRRFSKSLKLKNYLYKRFTEKLLFKRLKRIFLPFLPLFIIFLCFTFQNKQFQTLKDFFYYLAVNGWGPGSYYIPVLIQLYLIWPFIHYFSRHYFKSTLVFIIAFAIIFEILVNLNIFPELYYRYYIHRQLPFISFGILMESWYEQGVLNPKSLFKRDNGKLIGMIFSLICGLIFIISNQYFNVEPLIFKNWKASSVPTVMYVFPVLVFLGIFINNISIPAFSRKLIMEISKASYHIYLIQMFYYLLPISQQSNFIYLMIQNLIICLSLGILYYWIEQYILKKIDKSILDLGKFRL